MIKSICVYCGSNAGADPVYAERARRVGQFLAMTGRTLVYGGGQVGLMGVVADAAIDAGGTVIGIIPDFLHRREVMHPRVRDLRVVTSMHERKQMMADESDAFIALPGGIGTMEELFEVWTWSQLGRHQKPVALLNVNGYFDGLLTFLDTMTAQGFLQDRHRRMLIEGDTIEEVMAGLERYEFPGVIDTLAREQT